VGDGVAVGDGVVCARADIKAVVMRRMDKEATISLFISKMTV
jgi:hypothetical protein